MKILVTFAVFCGVCSYVFCAEGPCNLIDDNCLGKLTTEIFSKIPFSKIVDGDSSLGIENLDPIYHDTIDGNLSILKYSINDSKTYGIRDCEFKPDTFKQSAGVLSLHFEILCPKFEMRGTYEINGRLIVLPIEGKGDFFMNSHKYKISVDTEQKIARGKDGKLYMSVKSFKQSAEPLGSIAFDFKNLFNGQKDLAEAVLKFANEYWYEVAKEVQNPIFTAHVKKIINNYNKFLKKLPLDDLVTL